MLKGEGEVTAGAKAYNEGALKWGSAEKESKQGGTLFGGSQNEDGKSENLGPTASGTERKQGCETRPPHISF